LELLELSFLASSFHKFVNWQDKEVWRNLFEVLSRLG